MRQFKVLTPGTVAMRTVSEAGYEEQLLIILSLLNGVNCKRILMNHTVIMSKIIELILFKFLIRGPSFLSLSCLFLFFKFLIVFLSFCVCLLKGGLDLMSTKACSLSLAGLRPD